MQSIPVYSIDKFNSKTENTIQFQIEPFDIHRNFKVTYPHRHDDFYEILFITQGEGVYTIDMQDYVIKPYTIFFVSPGQIHELVLSEDVQGFIFLFTSSFYHFNKTDPYKLFELPFFYNLAQETPPLYLENEAERQNFIDLFKKAIQENYLKLADNEEVIRALLDLVLIQSKRIYPVHVTEESTNKGRILVKRFKQLIEEKCQENLSVKEYAELLKITSNHLSETVKNITGRTSTDLINDRMIMEIKRLLTHTDLGVSQIAYQLNFADQSYFSKYFKKLTNQTPVEFRKNL
ncbi:AraC family transcriptional regulator [Arcicella sp. LKC2W]|uniref:helix-turn-helix domain-containing protein n=1 Tax=Arcicella sp. LKC2W TaxID=2984198 RepID=UPI002B203288|nr:AraC family transcriptional regulator [Arcicella sp. LKC2W]MEA5460153.1 AraC family transcriptional regulator [Arcicella sp. LKC2W]